MLNQPQSIWEYFFVLGEYTENLEQGTYIGSLVILSYVIACLGSFTGLRLSSEIYRAETEVLKNRLHYGGAFAFGTGIWSMHFIGMLAYDMDMVHSYKPVLTLLSMLIAVVIAYGVLGIIRSGVLAYSKLASGAVMLGAAICSMHYVGMAAMDMEADLRYIPSLFSLSVVIAVTASGVALWIVFTLGQLRGKRKLLWQIAGALVLGAAICGMHYTGMEASVFIPYANCRFDPEQHFDGLVMIVAVVSTAIFAIAITLSMYTRPSGEEELDKMHSGQKVFLQLSMLLSVFLVLLIGSYFFFTSYIREQEQGSVVLNAAQNQKLLIERYIGDINTARAMPEYSLTGENGARFAKNIELVDTAYRGVLLGGFVFLNREGTKAAEISALNDSFVETGLRAAKKEWEQLKRLAYTGVAENTADGGWTTWNRAVDQQIARTLKAQQVFIDTIHMATDRENDAFAWKQKIILSLGAATFLLTILYARIYIGRPIDRVREDLRQSRDNLKAQVYEQTKDLVKAKEKAERLHEQMQLYTDSLEEARLEQEDAHRKVKHEARTVKLFERVTSAVNQAVSISSAIRICLDEICAYTGWPIGHAYLYDAETSVLTPTKLWYLQDIERFQNFQEVTDQTFLSSGEDLPGQVLEKGHSIWICGISEHTDMVRSSGDVELPIKTGVGFPVLVKNEVVAVLEFYTTKFLEEDENLMRVMNNIGTQLGRVVERERMKEARREAEKANQAKSEFLANMSHELRTPLNSIIGLSNMLAEDADPGSEEQYMEQTIHRSALYLLEIVNDILDLSKIDSGEMTLETIGFDLSETAMTVIQALAPLASSKGLLLEHNLKEQDLPYVVGDPVRMKRVLTNLVGNALKYTSHGRVSIEILPEILNKQEVEITCSIDDTGIGIPADKLDAIFQRFSQADETTTRKYGGTGLGLAITRNLVSMMGGEIGVESVVGRGSRFWFKIRFEIASELHSELGPEIREVADEDRDDVQKVAVGSARILVAEDHELNQVFIKKLLRRLGFEKFDLVETGLAAVEAVERKSYDLVLMDCHMPEMNGYDATKTIRRKEKGKDYRLPVVALTADAMAGKREVCLAAGMDDYVTKPINQDIFETVLSQWFTFPSKDEKQEIKKEESTEVVFFDSSALENYADTREEMEDFCEIYFSKTEESLSELVEECLDGENERWVEITHQLKGSSGMIGAVDMQKLCETAQAMVEATAHERRDMLEAIKGSYVQTKKAFKEHLYQST